MEKTYTLINDTTSDRHIGCDAVIKSIKNAAETRGYCLTALHNAGSPITGEDYRRLFSESDLIVVNGEGSMHDDSKACKNIAHFIAVAKENRKRVALINASYTRNSLITAQLVSAADLISFRDEASQREYLSQYSHKATRVVGDLSLLSFPEIGRTQRKAHALFTDSVIPERTRQLMLGALITGGRFCPIQDRRAVPSKNNPGKLSKRVIPSSAIRVAPSWRTAIDFIANHQRTEFYRLTAGASILITGRYHAVAYAIRFCIPFLYIPSNTNKIENFLSDVGLDPEKRKILGDMTDRAGFQQQILTHSALAKDEIEKIDAFLEKQKRDADLLYKDVFAD